jgi:glycosyltransferase involved in cell wall biosynthesis
LDLNNNTYPFISIIVPVYNCASTIASCLESIVKQNFPDFEVIIMDGLSGDNSPAICKTYSGKYSFIRYTREKDQGIYDAMNKGIRKARGEWIYFLGGDDILFDEHVLEKFALAARKYAFKLFYANVLVNGDTSWAKNQQVYDGYFDVSKLLTKNICHQAILYNKELFTEYGGFNVKYVVCADFDMNLRIAAKYQMKHLDFISAIFNPGGASSTITDQAFMEDLNTNIIRYFHKQLYKSQFKKQETQIISQAKNGNYSILNKIYLLSIGYYFKVQRKLRDN